MFWVGGVFNAKPQRFLAYEEWLYLHEYGDIIDKTSEQIDHCCNNTRGLFQKDDGDSFVNDVGSINYNERGRVGA